MKATERKRDTREEIQSERENGGGGGKKDKETQIEKEKAIKM